MKEVLSRLDDTLIESWTSVTRNGAPLSGWITTHKSEVKNVWSGSKPFPGRWIQTQKIEGQKYVPGEQTYLDLSD